MKLSETHSYVIAEVFKYSHMKQKYYSSSSMQGHLNSRFLMLKDILSKL